MDSQKNVKFELCAFGEMPCVLFIMCAFWALVKNLEKKPTTMGHIVERMLTLEAGVAHGRPVAGHRLSEGIGARTPSWIQRAFWIRLMSPQLFFVGCVCG